MDIVAYSKRVGNLNKSDVLKSLGETKGMLETLGDPLKELTANGLSIESLLAALGRAEVGKELTSKIHRSINIDLAYSGAIAGAIQVNKACIEEFARVKANILSGETLTIRQANVLLINSALDLWVDYTNRILQYGTNALLNNSFKLSKPDADFFTSNMAAYVDVTLAMFTNPGVVVKRLKALPDLPADEATVNVLETSKGKDSVLALPIREWGIHTFLPVYWVKLGKMEFDLWRIRVHSDRIESNSMKIQQLRDKQLNNPNPAIERAIETYENRIIKAQSKIEDIQKSYDYHE